MFDVFTDELEVQIKKGIANLYWFLGDLEKAWLRAGVDNKLTTKIFSQRQEDGSKFSKRQLMDLLYKDIRNTDFNRRLEISRNFVRFLVEHKNFVPASENHRIDIAETCALKLREIINKQKKEFEYNQQTKKRPNIAKPIDYHSELLRVRDQFLEAESKSGQDRGYAFEKVFVELMKISGIPVEEPFKIIGEQIDGAIKYGGHYYLVELKWTKTKSAHKEISSLYMKVEGKLEARGIFISMNGYSSEIIESMPKGKKLTTLLLDGVHFSNVIFGQYKFQELLEHSISQASLKGEIYCTHSLAK
ncbi:MAG: restriction endonuclease [Bacteroidota bacterium]|nr:restriction endonuclease [Bacteroidota bacterium]